MSESFETTFSRVRQRAMDACRRGITRDRVLRYLRTLSETPAPSGTAWRRRGEALRELFASDGVMGEDGFRFHRNFQQTGNTVVFTGNGVDFARPVWFLAHLDEISYLVQPSRDNGIPLIPYCYHLLAEGREEPARVVRFDLDRAEFVPRVHGHIRTEDGSPYFYPESGGSAGLRPGDRVVFEAEMEHDPDTNLLTGHLDNAAAAAALAVAASVLARLGVPTLAAFPDEEEGPTGTGNQTFGRGSRRLIDHLPVPRAIVVSDMQQGRHPNHGDQGEPTVLGGGAVISEVASKGRGAVTPPPLYELLRRLVQKLSESGVMVQESGNQYISRSDDVNAFLKTPNVVLMGFPGINRHFDEGKPTAHLEDLVNLSRSFVFLGFLSEFIQNMEGNSS